MYEHILVPVDGSPASNKALLAAIALAKDQTATTLRIVHVVDDVMVNLKLELLDAGKVHEALRQFGQELLDESDKLARGSGVQAQTKLIDKAFLGEPIATTILKEARSWAADLIVMGAHGRSLPEHFLTGSVATGVLHRASMPVLLVPSR